MERLLPRRAALGFRSFLGLSLVALSAACTGSGAEPETVEARDTVGVVAPEHFSEMTAREAEPAPEQPLSFSDGGPRGRVRGAIRAKVEQSPDRYSFSFDIGAESPVHCWALPDEDDWGRVLSARVRDLYSGATLGVPWRRADLSRRAMGQVAGRPYVRMTWDYLAPPDPERKPDGDPWPGQVKTWFLAVGDASVYCLHDEPGFQRTFEDVTEGLGASLEPASRGRDDDAARPIARDIERTMDDDEDLELQLTEFFRGTDGDVIRESRTVRFPIYWEEHRAPVIDGFWEREVSDAEGRLLEHEFVATDGGDPVAKRLEQVEPGVWRVQGILYGTPIDHRFDAEELGSAWGRRLAFEALGRGEIDRFEQLYWVRFAFTGPSELQAEATGPPADGGMRPITVEVDRSLWEGVVDRHGRLPTYTVRNHDGTDNDDVMYVSYLLHGEETDLAP